MTLHQFECVSDIWIIMSPWVSVGYVLSSFSKNILWLGFHLISYEIILFTCPYSHNQSAMRQHFNSLCINLQISLDSIHFSRLPIMGPKKNFFLSTQIQCLDMGISFGILQWVHKKEMDMGIIQHRHTLMTYPYSQIYLTSFEGTSHIAYEYIPYSPYHVYLIFLQLYISSYLCHLIFVILGSMIAFLHFWTSTLNHQVYYIFNVSPQIFLELFEWFY